MFRQMLMTSASRMVRGPNDDDEGGEDFQDEGDAGEFEEDGDEQDDLGDGDAGDEGDDEGDVDPPPQQSRGQRRHQAQQNAIKTEKERGDRLEAELAEARRQPGQPRVSPEEQARQRTAHLATLTEAGRLEFLQQESEQRVTARLNQIEFNNWDGNDKTAFRGMCVDKPAFKVLEAEVETELTRLRGTGQNASRETIAYYLLGKKAADKAPRAKAAGQRREQESRERQNGRSVNGRGDVAPSGSRRTSDREARRKRLEGVTI